MKIKDIYESTTAGSVASVAMPVGETQKRGYNLLSGKKTSKKYANSVNESKMKELASDLRDMDNGNFQKKYKKSKEQMKHALGDPYSKKTVHEADLQEDDLILVPGQGHRLKTGFHAFDPDKAEHEGETLKNSLRTIARNAKELHNRLENQDQFPEWVSEKIGTIKGMMTAVTEYLISKQEPSESAGVIAGGGVGEGLEHFDHEISMAKGEMRSAAKAAKRIYDMLNQRDELMAWQQSYITLASDYLDSVADSMEEEHHSDLDEEGKGLWANIHAKRERIKHGSGERMRKPGSKGAPSAQDFKDAAKEGRFNEAQSLGGALKNSLAKAEPGSKLDNSIKAHNRDVKNGGKGTLKNAPTGYHFDNKGYCRLGDK